MYLLEEILRIKKERKMEKIMIFVDMDGVIADYRFGEGISIRLNKKGTYLNKRPITTTINSLKILSQQENIELSVISSCLFKDQVKEKDIWLDKYADFLKKENRIYVIADDFESRIQLKVDKIKDYMSKNKEVLTILIDDTHEVLFLAQKQLDSRFIPMHVITLID